MLNRVIHGTNGAPLLIAHGLFGSARNWGVLGKRLALTRKVQAVDMRNHGASPWFQTQTYPEMADDLAEIINGRSDILGHSMGGKAAMILALSKPEKVARLIVADIAPVTYSHTQQHLIQAMQSIDLQSISSRRDADVILSQSIDEATVRAFLLQSLDFKSDPSRWMLNLDVLRGEMANIIGFPDICGRFDGPVLFLTGGASDYVQPDHHANILKLFPNAIFRQIPGAGHWLHAEKPREFEAEITAFLAN